MLLERDAALAGIDQGLRDTIAGGGSLLLVEGPAGIGKTRLVVAAGRHGRELGLTTLSARGSELERDFAYGLVRQLFEAPLVAASPPDRAELLAGAAGHAAALFGVPARDDIAGALLDPSFAILHGLYWLCANLGRRGPLLLCIDDVHWADQASLRFLHYLGRRLEELPVAVVAAARPAGPADRSPLLAALAASPSADVLVLAPLSERAVAELVRQGLGADVEPVFAAACHEVTGGVPFLVNELIRAIAEAGIRPAAAACSRVAALTPRAVAHSVVQRLSRLSAAARALAAAAAVLGEADLRLAAGLADVEPGAATAADELAAAGILEEGRPLRFVHPIVRAAVESDLPPGQRADLHAAAARRLADEGASAHRVAAHLLATDPAGDDWVVESLWPAARAAIANGAPDSAVAYLRRALAEPPSGRLRPGLLLELGFAESYTGDPQAAAHLEQALDTATDATAQVSITLALGRMLQIEGRMRESLEVFDRTRARLASTDRRAALTLEGAALGAAQIDAETAGDAAERIARLRRLAEEEDPDIPPSVFGMLATAATMANEPAETAARLALRALDGAPKLLPEAIDRPPFFYHACIALTLAERHGEALARFDEALADARRLGSLSHVLGLSCYRALAHLRTGNLADAEADARVALETGPRLPGVHAAAALAVLLETLAERGEPEAAETADARYRLAEQFPTMVQGGWLLAARGRLRLAELRPAEALGDLLAAGDLFARLRSLSSTTTPWRSDAALAHLALGAPAEARALASEEVTLAQAYHGPRALGIALRAAGLAEGGRRGIELLRQAGDVLEGSAARLEHARAMTDLGAALRRAGHRAESREILRPALDLAHRCGALALAERARTELIAAGGRPRRLVLSGLDSLTPGERRVAQLAAAGLANREIAQNLFITARTVEGHLTHAYHKLDIAAREQLPAALTPPGSEATTPSPASR